MELNGELRGTCVSLRTLCEDDVGEAYARWMNDPDVVRYTESRFASHGVEELRRYVAAVRRDPDALFLAMIAPRVGHIGNIKLGPIDRAHATGDIGLLIGEKEWWGKGCASEAIRLISDHAFVALGLEKLTAGVYAPNVGCIKAFERAGFEREGVQRGRARFEGGRVDVVLVGKLKAAA
jgi:ribosomal-protein-alanine N-acetyltransferase